jgi:hypothetical protein
LKQRDYNLINQEIKIKDIWIVVIL